MLVTEQLLATKLKLLSHIYSKYLLSLSYLCNINLSTLRTVSLNYIISFHQCSYYFYNFHKLIYIYQLYQKFVLFFIILV